MEKARFRRNRRSIIHYCFNSRFPLCVLRWNSVMNNALTVLTPILYAIGEILKDLTRATFIVFLVWVMINKK